MQYCLMMSKFEARKMQFKPGRLSRVHMPYSMYNALQSAAAIATALGKVGLQFDDQERDVLIPAATMVMQSSCAVLMLVLSDEAV